LECAEPISGRLDETADVVTLGLDSGRVFGLDADGDGEGCEQS